MKKVIYVIILIALLVILSCEKDTTTPSDNNPVQMGLNGVVQKGPFITGSSIQIQELNENLSPNGTSFNVTTEDNFGSFTLESEVSTDFIEIISTGFYFNEVTGSNTDIPLVLRAVSPVSDSLKCNINILTTLAKKRIVYLINEESKTYAESKQLAQNEILDIFSIHEAGVEDFEKMDISADGNANGILLAVSAILQGQNTVSELSLLISTIIEDISTDGILDDIAVKNEIIENAKFLPLPSVRKNIESRYFDLGLNTVIPNFEQYINNIWTNTPPTCDISKLECVQTLGTATSTVSALDGKPMVIGSQASIQVSSADTDGTVSKVKIYLDNVLVDSTSMGTYSWMIADTTKFHTIKAVVYDDDEAQAIDSVNYEMYSLKWIQKTNDYPHIIGSLTDFVSFNQTMYTFEMHDFRTYSSQNGSDWIFSNNNLMPTPLDTVFQNKIWVINDQTFLNSSDGITWNNLFTYNPFEYIIGSQTKLFLHNDNIWGLFFNMNNDKGELYKLRNDSLIFQATSGLDFSGYLAVYSEVIEIGDEILIYKCDGSKKAFRSSSLSDWILEENILPFDDTFPDTNSTNPKTPLIIKFNQNIYAVTNKGELWTSNNGYNWDKEVLLTPKGGKDIFIHNNSLWIYDIDNGSIYNLKKYFD